MEVGAEIRTDELVVDQSLQPRVDGLDADHVRTLEETAKHWSPLKVVQWDGRYLLVDGFHRLEAAKNLKLETVPVEVLETPADGDLQALAFTLNAGHGRPSRSPTEELSLRDYFGGNHNSLTGRSPGAVGSRETRSVLSAEFLKRVLRLSRCRRGWVEADTSSTLDVKPVSYPRNNLEKRLRSCLTQGSVARSGVSFATWSASP